MSDALPVTIVTGASRGLGLALAQQLLQRGHRLLTMQRQPAAVLASATGAPLEQWSVDLADPLPVARRLRDWIAALPRAEVASLTLVNNAALLVEPGPLAGADLDSVSRAARASLEAPLLLTAAFLEAGAGFGVPRKVLQISSGLGRHAMAGSAVYCAVKAGLDHAARSIALEEARQPGGARICSLAPGVIDTDMQVQLRGGDPAAFPEQARFASLKSQGRLDSPETAAARVLAWLERADFGAEPAADVRDAG
jgi:NAD(P)-dependent dehydrogenase (short-subunit alcohol dehydrogenase family)